MIATSITPVYRDKHNYEGIHPKGYASTGPALPTLEFAIKRLHEHGHLGQHKCLVIRVKKGWAAFIVKGKSHRVWQGDCVGARVAYQRDPKNSAHAWLRVPIDCVEQAADYCDTFTAAEIGGD